MRRKRKTHRLQMALRMGHPKSQERKESSQEQPLPPFANGAKNGAPEKSKAKCQARPPEMSKTKGNGNSRSQKKRAGRMPAVRTARIRTRGEGKEPARLRPNAGLRRAG